jgi:hypothetical protein
MTALVHPFGASLWCIMTALTLLYTALQLFVTSPGCACDMLLGK